MRGNETYPFGQQLRDKYTEDNSYHDSDTSWDTPDGTGDPLNGHPVFGLLLHFEVEQDREMTGLEGALEVRVDVTIKVLSLSSRVLNYGNGQHGGGQALNPNSHPPFSPYGGLSI